MSCPPGVPQAEIDRFINDNENWIDEQRGKIQKHDMDTGDRILYFGKQYDLVTINSAKDAMQIMDPMFVVYTTNPAPGHVKRIVQENLARLLYEFSRERVDHWCGILSLPKPALQVGQASGKWGCCYKSRRLIRISLMTVALDASLADMICLHEVCHLVHANHSAEFWALMRSVMPDLESRKRALSRLSGSVDFRNLYS